MNRRSLTRIQELSETLNKQIAIKDFKSSINFNLYQPRRSSLPVGRISVYNEQNINERNTFVRLLGPESINVEYFVSLEDFSNIVEQVSENGKVKGTVKAACLVANKSKYENFLEEQRLKEERELKLKAQNFSFSRENKIIVPVSEEIKKQIYKLRKDKKYFETKTPNWKTDEYQQMSESKTTFTNNHKKRQIKLKKNSKLNDSLIGKIKDDLANIKKEGSYIIEYDLGECKLKYEIISRDYVDKFREEEYEKRKSKNRGGLFYWLIPILQLPSSTISKKELNIISKKRLTPKERFPQNGLDEVINDTLGISPSQQKSEIINEFFEKLTSIKTMNYDEKELLYKKLSTLNLIDKNSISLIKPSYNGFTSLSSFTIGDIFVKMDKAYRIEKEAEVYDMDFGSLKDFIPKKIISASSFTHGIIALTNIQKEIPGHIKANQQFNKRFGYNDMNYHLFLMGLFHKEATRHLNDFDQVIYQGVHDLPHFEESRIPFVNQKGQGYKAFKKTKINPEAIAPIIKTYREYQEQLGDTTIHGDWKEENVPNGHLVDMSMVGRGLPADELAYFLSDAKYRTTKEQYYQAIKQYSEIRQTHDQLFKNTTSEEEANSSLLTQLVLRHSVMNKRDMNNPEKYKQREFYQQAINKLVKEAKFV